jgi:hypothetical protein
MRWIFTAVIIIILIILLINCAEGYDWVAEFSLCNDEDAARRIFRAAALVGHPDKCGDTPECALNFIALREAYIARVKELTGGGGDGDGTKLNADDERWLTGFQKRCRGYNWKEVKSGAAGGWLAWRVGTNGGVSLPALPVSVATLSLTPKEVYAAGYRHAFNVTAQRQCPACSGRGLKVDALPACNTCNGHGWVASAAAGTDTVVGEIGRVHTCGACCGSGGTTHICPLCHGTGIETSSSSLKGSIHIHGVKPQTTLHILESWERNNDAQEQNSPPPPWLLDPSWMPVPKSVTVTFSWLENGGIGAPRAECGGGSYCGGAPLFPRISFIAYPHIDIDARVSILRWCRSNAVIVPLLNGTSVRILLPTRPRTLPNDGIVTITSRDLGFPLDTLLSNDANTNTDTNTITETSTSETRGDVRIALRLLYPSRLGFEDISLLEDCLENGNGSLGESEDPVQHVIDSSELVSILSAAQGSEPDDDDDSNIGAENVLCDASDMLRSCLRRRGYFFYVT